MTSELPRHVAIIMDGAGRWAELRGQERSEGHVRGMESAVATIRTAIELEIAHLTLYTFSLVNWERPRGEVDALMGQLVAFSKKLGELCRDKDVRVSAIGDIDELRTNARRELELLQKSTAAGTRMVLTLAVSYGGRRDVAQAARVLAARARAGLVLPEDIDEASLHREMSSGHLPPVDLLIRTGGETTLSDFLVYEAALAHLQFLPIMWPDFSADTLRKCLRDYAAYRNRVSAGEGESPPDGFDPPSDRLLTVER